MARLPTRVVRRQGVITDGSKTMSMHWLPKVLWTSRVCSETVMRKSRGGKMNLELRCLLVENDAGRSLTATKETRPHPKRPGRIQKDLAAYCGARRVVTREL